VSSFTIEVNRSERAIQTRYLVPVLANPATRYELLASLQPLEIPIHNEESDQADTLHFVWVLRDSFTTERDAAATLILKTQLITRWCGILELPHWATDIGWWRHPSGSYHRDREYIVHPCSRQIGWTEPAINQRLRDQPALARSPDAIATLIRARRTMNTECDCIIQTPIRIIVVECKDKTSFVKEQKVRQQALHVCLERLIPRPQPVISVELSNRPHSTGGLTWSWSQVKQLAARVARA